VKTRPNRCHLPYPHPAVSHEPRMQQLHEDFQRLGLQPFHVLSASSSRRRTRTSVSASAVTLATAFLAGLREVGCQRAVCGSSSRASQCQLTLVSVGNQSSGREVTRVVVERGVRPCLFRVVSLWRLRPINSAARLLRSANEKHPRGSPWFGCCGRHYMGTRQFVLMPFLSAESNRFSEDPWPL